MALRGFSWIIEGELAGMALPGGAPEDWRELSNLGVGAIVNLTSHRLPEQEIRREGLDYLQLTVGEFRPPTQDQVDRFVAFCDRHIDASRAVAVHCLAGRGRTGTMAACYMVWRGMEPDAAIKYVRRLRPGSIETGSQEDAVREYAARLQVREDG
ncbi:MAG: dual specificity protein phosphatase family protein [Candidatus Brocadiia bacterium]